MKKFFAVVLALVAPPAIYFTTLGVRNTDDIAHTSQELRELTIHLEQARAAQHKLSQFHDELARLGSELTKLRTILPPAMQIDDIRALTEAKAAAHGVHVTRFEPGTQSVTAEVTGSAEGTSEFFRDIQNATRVIDVSYVTLRKDPAGWRTDFVMTAYALPD